MNDLTARVLNAIPAGAYEINALLSLLRIEETDTVETASVSCDRRPVLRINPEFVRRHCSTDEHLFLLVMHELHHVLLGHTRLFRRSTYAHNLAFDALINAMLMQRFPAQTYRSFFLDYYGAEEGPLRLLAPPSDNEIHDPALRRLHHLLYEDNTATSEEIYNAVVKALKATEDGVIHPAAILIGSHGGDGDGDGEGGTDRPVDALNEDDTATSEEASNAVAGVLKASDDGAIDPVPILLGSHGDTDDGDEWGTEGPVDAPFIEAIRQIVEKWPLPEVPIRGRSLADALSRADVRPDRPAARVLASLRRALLGAATRCTWGAARESRTVLTQDVVPSPSDRRAAVMRSLGAQPLLYWRPARQPRRGRAGRARVYLDVSGSMGPYVPFLYGALVALREYVEPDIYLFSTAVSRISLRDLEQGRLETTHGTDIDCVIAHALTHRVRKMLIVTDGYVGAPGTARVEAIRRSGLDIRVALTPEGWRQDLETIAARLDELPELAPQSERRAS